MSDDALLSLWFIWKGFFYWSMVTLIGIGGVYAASVLIRLPLPHHRLVLLWVFKLGIWVPIVGTSISWILMEWIGRQVFSG